MQPSVIGARKMVPFKTERIVAFGDFHISVSSGYSTMRWRLGVMVAHLTATPSRFVAWAASTVTWSPVLLRFKRPRS